MFGVGNSSRNRTMNFDRDPTVTDEYFVTANQIFDCCGVESTGSLRVDSLMDKFAPFVKTNKAEFSYLKSLLDPEQSNPDINVTKLAKALHKYSESQKTKVDLDESFNLKTCGQVPQDSDSGISSDDLQHREELQCELKEKEHLIHHLRSQLDYCDRQHEEALAAMTCERDTLRAHLNVVREENASLSHVRRDYDEVCERLCASETALGDAKRELDALRKRVRAGQEQVSHLENDKLTLQELLAASKDECHRINEMYASRQSALLEQNETLRTEHGELAARYHDQDEFMQHLIKEKVHLEMELKELLNKSNQTALRLDRSIDVSYTDDQMLTALDTMHADSRFSADNRILDEESFLSALKEDQGRPTNMSLFDEIRLSICNMSRITLSDVNFDRITLDRSVSNNTVHIETQTDEIVPYNDCLKVDFGPDGDNLTQVAFDKIKVDAESQTDKAQVIERCDSETQTDSNKLVSKGSQTLGQLIPRPRPFGPQRKAFPKPNSKKAIETQTGDNSKPNIDVKNTQTDDIAIYNVNNNGSTLKCLECENARIHKEKLEASLKCSNLVVTEVKHEIEKYEQNLDYLQKLIDEGKNKNKYLQTVVLDLTQKIEILQAVSEKQGDVIEQVLAPDVRCVDCQTEFGGQASVSTQVEVPCTECERRNAVAPYNTLRRFFWDALKCLFQLFTVVCFLVAVCALCGVAPGRGARGECRPTPWRWLHAQDLMDLLFRIEYTAEVPM